MKRNDEKNSCALRLLIADCEMGNLHLTIQFFLLGPDFTSGGQNDDNIRALAASHSRLRNG